MRKTILNIMATTGITLVVLALVAIYYGATVICISTVLQVLGLNATMHLGIVFLGHFEYRYSILETGLKLIYVLALVLLCGWIFNWYNNLSGLALILMTIVILGVGICLDTMSLLNEVKSINNLLESGKQIR